MPRNHIDLFLELELLIAPGREKDLSSEDGDFVASRSQSHAW